jgi:asparagine synthase (glutamine-hydrolysing)
MSGILSLISKDGAPIDRALLAAMAAPMREFASDATNFWYAGNIGLAHSFLRTGRPCEAARQPFTLDDRVRIVADARIDARAELIRELKSALPRELAAANDAELILHAYATWGENCVEHLLGDFAFVLWDGLRQHLMCARDHFGVRPLYYCDLERVLLISNSIWALRLHPAVRDALNEQAIADFLLFEQNEDLGTTFFADIRRLRPGHCLIYERGKTTVCEYWRLKPEGAPIKFSSPQEYVAAYTDVLTCAVQDRLQTPSAALTLSGGMDSSSIAAVACSISEAKRSNLQLEAFNFRYAGYGIDEEAQCADLIANKLSIPLDVEDISSYHPFYGFDDEACRTPEPVHLPFYMYQLEWLRRISQRHRGGFSGFGPDALLRFPFQPYVLRMLRSGRLLRATRDLAEYLRIHGRLPRLRLRSRFRRLQTEAPPLDPYPTWIEPEFARRLRLYERWREADGGTEPDDHDRSPACNLLRATFWPNSFEQSSPSFSGVPVEFVYPFFDLRVVNFCLRIPPIPWCIRKHIMREAMRGRLPERVLRRPKAVAARSRLNDALRERPIALSTPWQRELGGFVSQSYTLPGTEDPDISTALRPVTLGCWLLRYRDAGILHRGGQDAAFSVPVQGAV